MRVDPKRRTEQALRNSEAFYHLLFESNPHPLWVYDLETLAFLAVNDAAIRHYGYSREEFLAMTIVDLQPPEDIPALGDSLNEAGLWRHRLRDGALIHVRITSNTLVFAGRRAELVLVQDVTALHQAEARLQTQLIMLSALYTGARQLVESLDLDQIATEAAQAGVGMLGAQVIALGQMGPDGQFHLLAHAPTEAPPPPGVTGGEEMAAGQGLGGPALRSRQPVVALDVAVDPRLAPWRAELQARGLAAAAALPLISRGEAFGALFIYSGEADYFSVERLAMLQTFAYMAAAALVNARQVQALGEQRAAVRGLAARLAEVHEAERRALARELHDQAGANLSALALTLLLARQQQPADVPDPVLRRLDGALQLTEEILAQVRDVMAELRPAVLDDYGLLAALRWQAARVAERVGIAVRVEDAGTEARLAPATETALFRIAQEALINVVKHAQASTVTMRLEVASNEVRLVIADDGVGFDLRQDGRWGDRSGWGSTLMRERALAVGGQMQVDSAPGKGVCLAISVPRLDGA